MSPPEKKNRKGADGGHGTPVRWRGRADDHDKGTMPHNQHLSSTFKHNKKNEHQKKGGKGRRTNPGSGSDGGMTKRIGEERGIMFN